MIDGDLLLHGKYYDLFMRIRPVESFTHNERKRTGIYWREQLLVNFNALPPVSGIFAQR